MRLYKGKHNHNSGKNVNYFSTNMKGAHSHKVGYVASWAKKPNFRLFGNAPYEGCHFFDYKMSFVKTHFCASLSEEKSLNICNIRKCKTIAISLDGSDLSGLSD